MQYLRGAAQYRIRRSPHGPVRSQGAKEMMGSLLITKGTW